MRPRQIHPSFPPDPAPCGAFDSTQPPQHVDRLVAAVREEAAKEVVAAKRKAEEEIQLTTSKAVEENARSRKSRIEAIQTVKEEMEAKNKEASKKAVEEASKIVSWAEKEVATAKRQAALAKEEAEEQAAKWKAEAAEVKVAQLMEELNATAGRVFFIVSQRGCQQG